MQFGIFSGPAPHGPAPLSPYPLTHRPVVYTGIILGQLSGQLHN